MQLTGEIYIMELINSVVTLMNAPSYFGAPFGYAVIWVLMSTMIGIRVTSLSKWKPAGLIFFIASLILSPFLVAFLALYSNFHEDDTEKEIKRFVGLYLHCWQHTEIWKNCPEVHVVYTKLNAPEKEVPETHVLKSMNDRMAAILKNREILDGLYD